jgi:RimJ/RimL family protein N-acetyltransferase
LESAQRQFDSDTEQGNLTAVAEGDGRVVGFARARKVDNVTDENYSVPEGWYLLGVIVAPEMRRRGIATELTRFRLDWISQRAGEAFFFANSLNLASIDLHQKLGFVEVQRPFAFPGASFSGGGVGVLFRACAPSPSLLSYGLNTR